MLQLQTAASASEDKSMQIGDLDVVNTMNYQQKDESCGKLQEKPHLSRNCAVCCLCRPSPRERDPLLGRG